MYSESSRFQFGTLRGTIDTVRLNNSTQLLTYRYVFMYTITRCIQVVKELLYSFYRRKLIPGFKGTDATWALTGSFFIN